MKILNRQKNQVRLLVQTPEDLWYLHEIIEPGDILSGETQRKIRVGQDAAVRKRMYLTISVTQSEFSAQNLRVLGQIRAGPEDVAHGAHHSLQIEEGNVITLDKNVWMTYHWQRLKQACEEQRTHILIAVFDREQCVFARVKQQGFDVISTIKGDVQHKQFSAEIRENFWKSIATQLNDYEAKTRYDYIILASPSFWKDELLREINYPWKEKTVTATVSSADQAGLREALQSPETMRALQKASSSREMRLVDDLMGAIAKGSAVAYGQEDVAQAAYAASHLLVSSDFVAKAREQHRMQEIEEIFKIIEKGSAQITFIDSSHEGGKKLDGLGGIAALLRFAITKA